MESMVPTRPSFTALSKGSKTRAKVTSDPYHPWIDLNRIDCQSGFIPKNHDAMASGALDAVQTIGNPHTHHRFTLIPNIHHMSLPRRTFLKTAIAILPTVTALKASRSIISAQTTAQGTRLGVIAPYSFKGMGNDPMDLLDATAKLGLHHVELQSQAIEPWAGAPAGAFGRPPRRGQPAGRNQSRRARPMQFNLSDLTDAQQEALRSFGEAVAEPHSALEAARQALHQARFDTDMTASALEGLLQALATAEASMAETTTQAFQRLQASNAQLNARQIRQLSEQTSAGGESSGGRRNRFSNPAFEALMRERTETIRKWRLSQSMEPFKKLKKLYAEKQVEIGLVKFGLGSGMSDDEVDYCFQVAKAVGARGITCEPPVSEARRLGAFASKHKMLIGYHGHANVSSPEAFGRPGAWEQTFFYSPYNGANIDIGHFAAGNSRPATDFIRRYHRRITNIHVKDRLFDQGPNQPLGQGDSQVREILQLMKRERYEFMATIELEYSIPEGSDAMQELGKCVRFCQESLA